jgi:hypothetical protein
MPRPSSIHAAFTQRDQRRLARALARTRRAREYRRVAAVLAVAEGQSLGAVARQARVLARDPRTLGYRSTTWTATLLAHYCAEHLDCTVSPRTLRRRLHEHGDRWKRPRYRYRDRADHLAQKKGLSADA